jgi:glycosyltransferase involved in cell wall biosynthesis
VRFCHVTTFYGAQSFGGDASYVDRLAGALARAGHEVDVVHCADAFEAVRGAGPLRPWEPPPGVRVHTLRARLGRVSPLWSHQTGRPGPKLAELARLTAGADVVHFHNVSLLGAPDVLFLPRREGRGAKVLMTAHDYWLVCPMHLLWKLDRRVCERPQCVRCTLAAGRPPQLWRTGDRLARALAGLDALVFPSRFARDAHEARGVRARSWILPYFLPADWAQGEAGGEPPDRPYFVAAGRLVREKGFQDLIPAAARLPDVDLVVAGAGPFEPELRRRAQGLANVRFLGLVGPGRLARLYAEALAVIVPSRFPETFGYVVIEAHATGTPAIVRARGALPEVVGRSGGGIVFDSPAELEEAMRLLAGDGALRLALGERGRTAVATFWSEERHLERYLRLATGTPADRPALR